MKCSWCGKEMSSRSVLTCSGNEEVAFPDGTKLDSIAYDPAYGDESQRCHDCNVMRGGKHHPGCDMERCPKCLGQIISCGCTQEEEDDVSEV